MFPHLPGKYERCASGGLSVEVRATRHAERLRLYSSVAYRYRSAAPGAELSSKPEQFAMLRQPLLLLPLLAGSIVVLCGALQPKKPMPRPVVEPGAGSHDPATLEILDRAAIALSAEQIPWMQAKVWHQAECEDFRFQACGR